MANVTIPNLTSATTIAPSTDLMVLEQTEGTRKATLSQIFTSSATSGSGLGITSGGVYAIKNGLDSDISDINALLGNTSIASIGDGTVTGAVSQINSDLADTENDLTGKIIASLIPTTGETRGHLLGRVYAIIHNLNLNTPHMANIKLVYGGHVHTMVENNNDTDYRFMYFATSASGIEVARLVASAGTSVWNVSTIKADGSGVSTSDIANQVSTVTLHIVC